VWSGVSSVKRGAASPCMGEAAKHFLLTFQEGCHDVLRSNRGTLSHSNLFDDTARPQEKQRLETRYMGAEKRAFRASVIKQVGMSQSATTTCLETLRDLQISPYTRRGHRKTRDSRRDTWETWFCLAGMALVTFRLFDNASKMSKLGSLARNARFSCAPYRVF